MTLSFVTRWRDELPETYTALSPTPLNNARLIWHNTELANTLSIPSSLFKNGAGDLVPHASASRLAPPFPDTLANRW